MILYFSGTGNSRYAARFLSESLTEAAKLITEYDPSTIAFSGRQLGIVCPVYAWGIPPLMLDFISNLNKAFIKDAFPFPAWMVLTCGDETGLAPEMLENTLKSIGLRVDAGWSVIMPNVYVLLPGFNVDPKQIEMDKLAQAPIRMQHIADAIKNQRWERSFTIGSMPRLKSRLVFPLFKKWGIFPKKWRWSKECISCGKCVGACPVHNIEFINRHPRWRQNCISCLACYHTCPVHAVEYGKVTINKGQYHCPL
ncbi:MAG: EFR1 family ferrodoxin [Muribaculum sp.]|nr:EFR1 family ferrodoxin [Muribaculum sp.]